MGGGSVNREAAEALIEEAVDQVMLNDAKLIGLNACERALQFRLAHYIALSPIIEMPLIVDCEYNRHLRDEKRLLLPGRSRRSRVVPDILVHHRDSDDFNMLVVELKRPGQSLRRDREKLEAFVSQLGYRHAAHIVLGLDAFRGPMSEVIWVN